MQAALPGRLEECQGEDCTRRRLELEVSLHRAGEELERGQGRLKQLEVAAKQGRERLEQVRSQVSRGTMSVWPTQQCDTLPEFILNWCR